MLAKKVARRRRIRYGIRNKVKGTAQRPRFSVFRSNRDIYVQIIDDLNGVTLVAENSKTAGVKGTKVEQSAAVGKAVAEKAKAAGIEAVVFDRGGYLYHGRIKALAEGAREGGLQF